MSASFHTRGGFIQPFKDKHMPETQIYYRVRLNGEFISGPIPDITMVTSKISTLPPEQQALAEVVRVSSNGLEILLG